MVYTGVCFWVLSRLQELYMADSVHKIPEGKYPSTPAELPMFLSRMLSARQATCDSSVDWCSWYYREVGHLPAASAWQQPNAR